MPDRPAHQVDSPIGLARQPGLAWPTWPLDSWIAAGLLLLGLAVGLGTAWSALGQSLWLDELHTAWVADGPLEEVLPRAAQGNQLPLYFLWQWWLGRTVGQSELSLRATSLAAWCATLLTLASLFWRFSRSARSARLKRDGPGFLWVLVAAAAVDRNGLFFATEARPYTLLALVNLLCWWLLAAHIIAPTLRGSVARGGHLALWLIGNSVAWWLQPTAILSWFAQLLVWGVAVLLARSRGGARQGLISAAILCLIAMPAGWLVGGLWQTRQAWAAFAADASPANLLRQLPLLPIVGPVLLVASVRLWWSRHGSLPSLARADQRLGWVWLAAWALPLAWVAGLAATGIAPLVHPRYMFAAWTPLLVWAGWTMRSWSSSWGWTTSLTILGCLLVQQGSIDQWLSGRWAGPVRGEDWRSLVQTIAELSSSQSKDQARASMLVFCVSSLIEGNSAEPLPLEPVVPTAVRFDHYLAVPLQSLYHPDRWGSSVSARVVPLVNDPRTWSARIAAAGRRFGAGQPWWLAVRCSSRGLERRLEISGLRPQKCFDFGGVQLLRFQD